MGKFIKDAFNVRELSNIYPYTDDFKIILDAKETILRDRLLKCENAAELVECYEEYVDTPMHCDIDDYIEYLIAYQLSGLDECWFPEAEYEIKSSYNNVDYIDIHVFKNKVFIEMEATQWWCGDPASDGELRDFDEPKKIYVQCDAYMDVEFYYISEETCFEEFVLKQLL